MSKQYLVRIYYHSYVEKIVESSSEKDAYQEALRLLELYPEDKMLKNNLIEEDKEIIKL